MCGIAGICNYHGDGVKDILEMNRMMYRRGPDSGDFWVDTQKRIVLGHRRLSIVDLSDNGAQPMESASGRYVICYNGEVYNYKEIEETAARDGHRMRLRGASDTEVILNAFAIYGIEKTLDMMKGMFAIALWDREEKALYLMRDRAGEKPLYYGRVNGSFVFASDLASIEALEGFQNPVRTDVLPMYFQYGYIPAPYSIYQDIYKLRPGCYWKIEAPFETQGKEISYWDMKKIAELGQKNLFKGSEQEAAEHLEILLKGAIEGQMIADVPLGAFLSGGIDSALVVSLMQSMSKDKVKTFTIGFDSDRYNEAEYAKEIAAHLGTQHTELYVDRQDAMQVIRELPAAYSEPFADSSQIPTMLVSKMTKEHVTVSLSGDAGDELFCGYNTYRIAAGEWESFQRRFGRLPKGFRSRIGAYSRRLAGPGNKELYKAGNYFTMDTPEEAHRRMGLEDSRYPFIAKDRNMPAHSNLTYQDGFLEGIENNLMLMDLLQYHTDDILVKVDRAGMYYSLETRIPLLDRDVIEFAWSLPLSYKYSGGVTKRVLRDILYKYVPKDMMERPKKGFSIPLSEWMREGELLEWASELLDRGRGSLGDVLDIKIVDSLWEDYVRRGKWTEKLWYILMLEQWMLKK